MNNLSKALYLAAFALMFVFAASTAIYLYSTLSNYLDVAKDSADIKNRVENSNEGTYATNYKRTIPKGEVYITLLNMEQMNVKKLELIVGGISYTVEPIDVKDKTKNFNLFIGALNGIGSTLSSYSVSDTTVTYRS